MERFRISIVVTEDEFMLFSARKSDVAPGRSRPRWAAKASYSCEALEGRQLLSGGLGSLMGLGGEFSSRPMMAERSTIGGWRQDGMLGGGSTGLGGGVKNPLLLLTAPLIEGTGSSTTPPSPSVFSSSGVQTALQTLETDLKNFVPVGGQPTHASVGALEDTLDAIHKGTLTGSAAQSQIQSDEAAILTSMGLTSAQVSQIQSDQTALQTAITTASTTSSSSGSSSTSSSTSSSSATTSSSSSGSTSAISTALQTLRTDLDNDTPNGAEPTHASIGQVQDDLSAIMKGTLTGSAAVTQVQTDAAAVLTSMGLTSTQISTIQSDQQAVETAIEANMPSASTTGTSTSTPSAGSIAAVQSTLQSVAQYLVGLPGVSSIGMRGMSMGQGGNFGGGFDGGSGGGQGGGFGGGHGGGYDFGFGR
jgi:antitoxin component of RelBE/YafQ-DinJ toxin-antitoxin module